MLDSLRKIINRKVVLSDYDSSEQIFRLKEDDQSSQLSELKITHVPKDVLAFTLDFPSRERKFKQLSSYVEPKNGDGVNKGCDLVMLWQADDQICVLIFDLKSNKPNLEDSRKQLLNSTLFVQYLVSMAEHHYKEPIGNLLFKQAIVTTDARNIRKNSSYRPNQTASEYNILYVDPTKPRVSLNRLVR